MQKNHSDKFEVDIKLVEMPTESDIGKYDIHHFHRRIGTAEETNKWIEKFQDGGAIVIADIDDYWTPFREHPAYQMVIKHGVHQQILSGLKLADYVTTTTELYANHIRQKANSNVHVIPNAIDESLPMWKNNTSESDKVRVGWIGGSSHEKDLAKLNYCFGRLFLDPDVKDKIQVVMCGYDTRGTVTTIDPKTNQQVTRKIKPEESIWNKFESIFNDFGRANSEQYVRRNTLPITQYGKHYNFVDICLAPLEEHTFNECKSELKIIEAGMNRKALIASNLYVYKELLTDKENALLVDPRKDHKLWSKYIKQLILEPEYLKYLQNNLYNLVYPKYTLSNVTSSRCSWYEEILK